MGTILHIETATDICSVSLATNNNIVDIHESSEERSHASQLTVLIDEILRRNSLSPKDLSAVAVSMGPGSYTGLRIGVSVAKGVCYGIGIPLIAVPTLQSMFLGLHQEMIKNNLEAGEEIFYAPMIDARRMEVYVSLFDNKGNTVVKTCALIVNQDTFISQLSEHKIYFFGTGALKLKGTIVSDNAIFVKDFKISSAYMVPIAHERYENNKFEDVAYFEPFYLKDFIATIPKNKVLL